MIEAINDGLRRYVDFKGKSTKLQYNAFLFFYIAVDLFTAIVNPNAKVLNAVIMGALVVPLLAAEIRRSHDVGKSGWWVLVPFYSVYLMFKNSVPEVPTDSNSL
jgi:uncharacterized membrane protein YhaH (DUF805 family)